MFDRLVGRNAMPALERALQFASARQRVIVNNIANLETPGFRPVDVSVEGFQDQLRAAIDDRQARLASGVGDGAASGADGGLSLEDTDEVMLTTSGLELTPRPIGEGILGHDGNDRSLERILQSLTENVMQFRFAAALVRGQFASLDAAIRERP
ncbi:MAG: flagellar basal body protein [Phycisphaerae bacterium]|nr:flagellar basal body protein [Phycisphaerae bacterium]